jgi:hypothetical protein
MSHLRDLLSQRYPLSVSIEAAQEAVDCIRAIMELVPADDQVLVRGHYDDVTSAILHPAPEDE